MVFLGRVCLSRLECLVVVEMNVPLDAPNHLILNRPSQALNHYIIDVSAFAIHAYPHTG